MSKNPYKINQKVWAEGQFGTVVAVAPNEVAILHKEADNCAKVYPVSEVEVAVTELFAPGDLVRSHFTFIGKVIAFEEETNRVICKSTHPNAVNFGSRKRYAYLAAELVRILAQEDQKLVSFKPCRKYEIVTSMGELIPVIAVYTPQIAEPIVSLFRTLPGQMHPIEHLITLPESLTMEELKAHGIVHYRSL